MSIEGTKCMSLHTRSSAPSNLLRLILELWGNKDLHYAYVFQPSDKFFSYGNAHPSASPKRPYLRNRNWTLALAP